MYKHILLLTIILLPLSVLFGQSAVSGIQFQDITYKEAIELSKETGKPVFIDAYTVWCGPCKYMEKKVFTDEMLGKFFNEHFINIKVEMEKDAEGPELARKYRVTGYPTLLFIDQSERIISKQIGAVDGVILLDVGKSVSKRLGN